ncbi:hypothetical protein BU25DRAFT_409096 [Macroventuria anomochaeta]|uniref:Uncharacterized protein n=1 Tax=Macroventuria anomochaeta TaxID=301207 RepID=A0ACB6S727_9PLEO|nr:uncharacterized protein BU25DRAFT_409096 [Macroventuria anomochaeta]KAF2629838.1 hypothetical protein BU25DRAFT_409096 [Macroventuria anomochaeta]
MASLPCLFFLLLSLCTFTFQAVIPASPPDQVRDTGPSDGWSKEALITLVGVPVAVFGILIALASPLLHQCIRRKFNSWLPRTQHASRPQLQEEYNEWLEFNRWRDIRHEATVS